MRRSYIYVPSETGTAVNRAERYLSRADELRSIAAEICDSDCQEALLALASSYEEMAAARQFRLAPASIQ